MNKAAFSRKPVLLLLTGLIWFFFVMAACWAQDQEQQPDLNALAQGKIWIDEQTGTVLPLKTLFLDESGNQVALGSLIDKPTIILPIYFYCPNSCSTNLANLAAAISNMKLKPGTDYRVIALSFNDRDTPSDARNAKKNYLNLVPEDFPQSQWSFLTGSAVSISAVLNRLGYTFKAQKDGTFIHPSALIAVARNGTIIKYVYGTFIPGDVEMALLEAEKGTPALSVKRLLNFCFNYNPAESKPFFNIVKIAMLSLFAVLIVLFGYFFLRHKGAKKSSGYE